MPAERRSGGRDQTYRCSQGHRGPLPKCPKFNQKLRQFSLFLLPRTLLGRPTAAIQGSGVPPPSPNRSAPKTNFWLRVCDQKEIEGELVFFVTADVRRRVTTSATASDLRPFAVAVTGQLLTHQPPPPPVLKRVVSPLRQRIFISLPGQTDAVGRRRDGMVSGGPGPGRIASAPPRQKPHRARPTSPRHRALNNSSGVGAHGTAPPAPAARRSNSPLLSQFVDSARRSTSIMQPEPVPGGRRSTGFHVPASPCGSWWNVLMDQHRSNDPLGPGSGTSLEVCLDVRNVPGGDFWTTFYRILTNIYASFAIWIVREDPWTERSSWSGASFEVWSDVYSIIQPGPIPGRHFTGIYLPCTPVSPSGSPGIRGPNDRLGPELPYGVFSMQPEPVPTIPRCAPYVSKYDLGTLRCPVPVLRATCVVFDLESNNSYVTASNFIFRTTQYFYFSSDFYRSLGEIVPVLLL